MWQLEKFHPKILGAYELEPRERALLLQCFYVFARRLHFVGEHGGKTHDGRFLFCEAGVQFFIFSSLIGLHDNDFSIKHVFNMGLELLKFMEDFRLVFEKVDPSELTKIIDETHIVFISTN
jgi:hypothetical protein